MLVRQTADPATTLDAVLVQLGYRGSPFFREIEDVADSAAAHLLRDAHRAKVRGAYFIRTGVDHRERPAVYLATATTADDAREIHRLLWNQGSAPFVVVSLPGQVRVYTSFAYDATDESIGEVSVVNDLDAVGDALSFLRSESIDSGALWQEQAKHIADERRVDYALLNALRELSCHLIDQHAVDRDVAHSLVGRFVYLYYLRDRGILSDQWLESVGVSPDAVFSPAVRLAAFRRLTGAVDERFNGHIFPIDWSAPTAPSAEAVCAAGRAFSGEKLASGQKTLFRVFNFSYIPIELLSAIYEQFLHETGKGAERGAFYTAESLTDYILSEVDGVKALTPNMRVLDPCCGSGVFLVLAYRRLIEQEMRRRQSSRLTPKELRSILVTSIFGVERDRDACLVAEFSLILTLLSYIDPPELHRPPNLNFKFPCLHNSQIFEADFFDDSSQFWKRDELRFDWIVGNAPWKEIDPGNPDHAHAIAWMRQAGHENLVARNRLSEAFTWRLRDRLAADGIAGLMVAASSLTNDHSAPFRRAFFAQNAVYKVTNLANLTYVAFTSAKEPGAVFVYAPLDGADAPDIIHFGPLLVNQPTSVSTARGGRTPPWLLTVSEAEVQAISAAEAKRGAAETWKVALFGTPRDSRALAQLRELFPLTLGELARERGWSLALGLQLRPDAGPDGENAPIENADVARWFGGLRLMQKPPRLKGSHYFVVPERWLVPNKLGTFIRKRGGQKGLAIAREPHLFLWNEFAAFSETDFIIPHADIGLSAPPDDADWLRAIAMVWTSSITRYVLVLGLSSSWGIGRSVIDHGDASGVPVPRFTESQVSQLAAIHRQLSADSMQPLHGGVDWQGRVDAAVAEVLSIPDQIKLLSREFLEFKFPALQGRTPAELTRRPDEGQLRRYAVRLKAELDGFVQRRARRHGVAVTHSPEGIVASVEITDDTGSANVTVRRATTSSQDFVRSILRAAQQEYGQWVYVSRSVRVFSGRTIHICKAARRIEWTETQALLDAADIVAEVATQFRREA